MGGCPGGFGIRCAATGFETLRRSECVAAQRFPGGCAVAVRRFRCVDCPPNAPEWEARPSGPLPQRCPPHRARREALGRARAHSSLRVVAKDEAAPAPPDPLVGSAMADAVRADLEGMVSSHPAASTLRAMAVMVAEAIDRAAVVLDPREVTALGRELRAIMSDLAPSSSGGGGGGDVDDIFTDGAAPVVVPAPV